MMLSNVLFQSLEPRNDHVSLLTHLLRSASLNRILMSVAFVRTSGLELIEDDLRRVRSITTLYAGIRNGVTSYQAIAGLIRMGLPVYAVDTSSPSVIFHPKLFVMLSPDSCDLIAGSANLTAGGLNDNIEVSLHVTLDRRIDAEEQLVNGVVSVLESLPTRFPNHIFRVSSLREAYHLLGQGRLVDERRVARSAAGATREERTDGLEAMPLQRRRVRRRARPLLRRGRARTPTARPSRSAAAELVLFWESKPLTERDLNVPSGTNTNPTGSMLLKKGSFDEIDQRHYFRDAVFPRLTWTRDVAPRRAHIERAQAEFELRIKGISYGVYTLQLSHNTLTNTRTYEQRNAMTQIHWGEARSLIASRDLLGRTLRLLGNESGVGPFVIEIE
jgi:HKD family nuclease